MTTIEKAREITLKNSFHGTEATIRSAVDEEGRFRLSPSQVERVNRKLCPEECTCGGITRLDDHVVVDYFKDNGLEMQTRAAAARADR